MASALYEQTSGHGDDDAVASLFMPLSVNKILDEATQTRRPGTIMSMAGWTPIVEWILSALMVEYFGVHTFPAAWKTLNTDFSNYYLTARLAREKNDTSRIYEWIWLQRQKDHRDIDQRIISLVPITPFSTLAVWPLASMT